MLVVQLPICKSTMMIRGAVPCYYCSVFVLVSIRALLGSGLSLDPTSSSSSSSSSRRPTRTSGGGGAAPGARPPTPTAAGLDTPHDPLDVRAQEQNNDEQEEREKIPPSRSRKPKAIPITVLSGFLGSGKTSLLRSLLSNDRGLRIAVIVNDVASVNIDSKLVSQQQQQQQQQQQSGQQQPWGDGAVGAPQQPAGIVQLENGCACCSLSEELLGSVSELVLLSDLRGEDMGYDHIVVELSGVADPHGVRAKFQEAVLYDMPLMERVRLDTMVTLVDCSTFLSYLSNPNLANPEQSPELFYRPGEEPPPRSGDNLPDWADDLPGPLLEALLAGDRAYGEKRGGDDEGGGSVVDLLVSQCEIADVCLLNKVDLCDADGLRRITGIVRALNPRASLHPCQHGGVELDKVLAAAGGRGVAESGLVDDHKDAVRAAIPTTLLPERASSSHSHEHHEHGRDDPGTCSDLSHSHDHGHQHSHAHADDRSAADSASHSHRDDAPAPSCDDPACTDPSHSHSHSHDDRASNSYFGLGSFVYRARRPFHPSRLAAFLRRMPVRRGLPPPSLSDDASEPQGELVVSAEAQQALGNVIRSKGFAWSAESDVAAFFWSHAGVSFDWSYLGRWWATLERERWPPEAVPAIVSDFVPDRILKEDPSLDFVGDRRQEIVFIGPTLGSSQSQEAVSSALDQCLLNDEEWQTYCRLRADDRELQERFPNPIESRMLTY